jgi:hypothetical protein
LRRAASVFEFEPALFPQLALAPRLLLTPWLLQNPAPLPVQQLVSVQLVWPAQLRFLLVELAVDRLPRPERTDQREP